MPAINGRCSESGVTTKPPPTAPQNKRWGSVRKAHLHGNIRRHVFQPSERRWPCCENDCNSIRGCPSHMVFIREMHTCIDLQSSPGCKPGDLRLISCSWMNQTTRGRLGRSKGKRPKALAQTMVLQITSSGGRLQKKDPRKSSRVLTSSQG